MNNSFSYAECFPDDILSFISTRYGGFSAGVYKSFNMGMFTDDDKVNVLKNIELLKSCHNIGRLSLLRQVHGNKVIEVSSDTFSDLYFSEGDGLFTGESDLALGIFTADCFPVLLAGKKHIAALHCGWRSLNSCIIENALECFIKKNDFPCYAYVGPGICQNCYEVKSDMINKLDKRYCPESVVIHENSGKYRLNLKKLVENALKLNNIGNRHFAGESTCCSDMFYSHRRDAGTTGRMLSVIMRRQQ